MAIRTIKTYEQLIWDSIVAMLGFDPDAPETQDKVRRTFTVDGIPDFTIEEDIVFMKVFSGGDTYDQKVYTDNSEAQSVAYYTRTITLSLIAYGPSALEHLERIRVCFVAGIETLNLKAARIFPKIDPSSVIRIPELFDGQWWERADFSIIMYAEENTAVDIEGFASTEITVIADDDERREINV